MNSMLVRHGQLKKTDKDKSLAFEMYCYRRMLHLNWTMKVTNKEVRKRLNIRTDLMQTIMKRKLGLFGHNICRMENSRKIKSINQSIKIFIELLGMKQIDYKASQ